MFDFGLMVQTVRQEEQREEEKIAPSSAGRNSQICGAARNLADANAVPQIIEVEAKLIEAQNPQRWQNLLSLKRLWHGGKKASVKVGKHIAENNVGAKGVGSFAVPKPIDF